ncbi:MAG: sulfatase-like hydrolase/transferase [Opitutales bacterium]
MKKLLILLSFFFALNIFAQKPNVILVLTDDQGIGDLGYYGNKIVKTPNIDKFASESLHLMNFHVERACAPTRAALMTGRQCNSTGLWYTITQRAIVRKDESTIALELKKGGYTTGMFGKWHLGDMKPHRPQDKGFDRVVMHGSGGVGQTTDYWDNTYFDDTYFVDGKPQKFEGYCTDVFTAESIKFIEGAVKQKKPFFCYLATNAPHSPYRVGDEYANMYKDYKLPKSRGAFYGMITNIDDNFKKLMDKVDELGIRDNTIVIYMTDNGTANGYTPDKKARVLKRLRALILV